MSSRFLFEEDYHWPAQLVRAVSWSGTTAALWAVPFWLVGAAGALACYFFSIPITDGDNFFTAGWILAGVLGLSFISGVAGGITGFAACAYCNNEPLYWGPRSPVFCSFSRHVGRFSAAASFVALLMCFTAPMALLFPLITFIGMLANTIAIQLEENALQRQKQDAT